LCVIATATIVALFPAGGRATPARADLPLVSGKPALASINGEPLLLEEFERVLADVHSGASDNVSRPLSNPSLLLERLINAKLLLQEARNIGLDELPEVQRAEKTFQEDTLRGMLYGYHVRNISEPDPQEVEKRYRNAVKEAKVVSVLFDKEEDAKRLEREVRSGGKFEILAKKRIDAGEAKGSVEGKYLRFASMSPQVAKVVSRMKKGEVSPLIQIGEQFSLLKLEAVRYPKDKAAREQAEKEALQFKKNTALKAYSEELRKKSVKIDRKLLEGLDFETAEPGLDKLRADPRVLATVKGDKSVTVGDLTAALEKKFFHGAERAIEGKKINRKKDQALEEILYKKVTLLEARRQKLDRTEFYKGKVAENRNGLLFGAFVQKVIVPDVKVSDEELNHYYKKNISDYTFPEMVRIDGIAFSGQKDADDAIGKLRSGADFQWLRANAEGQVDPAKVKNVLEFRGQLLDARTLPEGVRKAISGAAAGDFRSYPDPGKVFYVLLLRERIPSSPMPLESAKAEIEKKIFSEKLDRVVREWEEKLRKASDVKIHATGKKLDRIVYPGTR